MPDTRSTSGGSTSGSGSSAYSGPLHARENAERTSAISLPSCSIRADSVLRERPSRSSVVAIDTGPGAGARAKWIVMDRGARVGSETEAISARVSIAAM